MLFEQEEILIFHPGKCGGTTIEQLFLRSLRNTDLARLLKEPCFNTRNNKKLKPWWLENRVRFMLGFLTRENAVGGIGGIYLQHADIYASLAIHRKSMIDRLFKVVFVRNPFPRILSAFYYNCWNRRTTFRDFVLTRLEGCRDKNRPYTVGHFGEMHRYTHLDGELYVDFLGRLEQMEEDVARLSEEVGVPLDVRRERRHARTPASKVYEHYSQAYDGEMTGIVYRLYRKDFDYFNYRFEREASFEPRDEAGTT